MVREDWVARARKHPGSTLEDIQDEPEWSWGHNHRVGFRNRHNRFPGQTTSSKPPGHDDEVVGEARRRFGHLEEKMSKEGRVNFRDIVQGLEDFHLLHPETRPMGCRFVLECTEDWVKYEQDWPADRKKEDKDDGEETQQEPQESKQERSPEESAFLEALKQEREYISNLGINDGNQKSPQTDNLADVDIDQADHFTPDNWFPRSPLLHRLTGSHPLNAEPGLVDLYDAGLITPSYLHYVRNHGSVPRLLWEFHKLDVEHGKLTLSMDELVDQFKAVNIPVLIACDGNRRGELNKIKKSKGFTWGSGGAGCAYWKGALLRDVLLAARIQDPSDAPNGVLNGVHTKKKRYWVNFEGADNLSEGKYATSIPLEFAMDPANDVLLAYEMNDHLLPPDHGYPVRVIIPGYVGGRCVKWLKRIWVSDKENDSYYHTWDNRVLPSFVTDMDGEFANQLFHHPDTACNEQNLNSVIPSSADG
ncbi:Oxidoreductase, molybdopterin-binding domain-containing protein, partial [Dactylonectria macrodidyma]